MALSGTPRVGLSLEVGMVRWTDLIGVAGVVLVITSFVLFSPASPPSDEWMYWLGVSALWGLGFVAIVGWLLTRWSIRDSKGDHAPPLIWTRGNDNTTRRTS